MASRTLYLDWVYDARSDNLFSAADESPVQREINERVRAAIDTLSVEEREFVHLYWFEGKPLPEIGELLGREPARLESLNRTAMRKLRARLSEYASTRFGIERASDECVICEHPRRSEIDDLLRDKPQEETFRRVMTVLRKTFDLRLSTPQIIVGHMKYHMNQENRHDRGTQETAR